MKALTFATLDSLSVLALLAKFVEGGLGGDAFGEDLVEFFLNAQLVLLELAQVGDHYCVLKVRDDHGLEHFHVSSRELSEAVIHHSAQSAIAFSLAVEDFLDVGVTLFQVVDYLLKVLDHQCFVAQQLLVLHQRPDLVLLNFLALTLLENGHGVEVVLSEEDDVEASLFKLIKLEGERAFSEHIDLMSCCEQSKDLTNLSVFADLP